MLSDKYDYWALQTLSKGTATTMSAVQSRKDEQSQSCSNVDVDGVAAHSDQAVWGKKESDSK